MTTKESGPSPLFPLAHCAADAQLLFVFMAVGPPLPWTKIEIRGTSLDPRPYVLFVRRPGSPRL